MPLTKPHTYLLIILMFFFGKNQVRAEHIYGGNLYMLQTDKDAGKFKIALNMFVDFIIMPASENTYPQATSVTIRIFRKRDNFQVQEISMPFEALQDLVYDNATCARKSQKIIFLSKSARIFMNKFYFWVNVNSSTNSSKCNTS